MARKPPKTRGVRRPRTRKRIRSGAKAAHAKQVDKQPRERLRIHSRTAVKVRNPIRISPSPGVLALLACLPSDPPERAPPPSEHALCATSLGRARRARENLINFPHQFSRPDKTQSCAHALALCAETEKLSAALRATKRGGRGKISFARIERKRSRGAEMKGGGGEEEERLFRGRVGL